MVGWEVRIGVILKPRDITDVVKGSRMLLWNMLKACEKNKKVRGLL